MAITLAEIKIKGWNILVKELGLAGATKFLLLYEAGSGDYVKERKKIISGLTVDKIIRDVRKNRRKE